VNVEWLQTTDRDSKDGINSERILGEPHQIACPAGSRKPGESLSVRQRAKRYGRPIGHLARTMSSRTGMATFSNNPAQDGSSAIGVVGLRLRRGNRTERANLTGTAKVEIVARFERTRVAVMANPEAADLSDVAAAAAGSVVAE